jgi:hypothetical protein
LELRAAASLCRMLDGSEARAAHAMLNDLLATCAEGHSTRDVMDAARLAAEGCAAASVA